MDSQRQAEGVGVPAYDPAAHAASLISKRVRVVLHDGRELVGELQCTDEQRNLILSQAFELIRDGGKEVVDQKRIGSVLVPAQHRKTCEVEVMPQDLASVLELLGQTR